MDTLFYSGTLALPILLGFITYLFFKRVKKLSWFKKIVGNTLVFLLLLSTLFLACESYYRFIYDSTDSLAITRTAKRWMGRHYKSNNWPGIRDNIAYSTNQAPNTTRISFVGDSFTAGHGIKDVEKRFSNLIRKEKPNWEIHNLGFNGIDTRREILVLNKLLESKYELDVVVLVYGINDILDSIPDWPSVGPRIASYFQTDNFLINHSYFLNTYYFRLKGRHLPDVTDYFHHVIEYYDTPVWEEQKRMLMLLSQQIKTNGGDLLVVTFPFLHNLGKDYPCREIHKKLDRFWKEMRIPHLDLLPLYETHLDKKLVVNRYDAHPNIFSHQLAAEAILAFLEKEIPLIRKEGR